MCHMGRGHAGLGNTSAMAADLHVVHGSLAQLLVVAAVALHGSTSCFLPELSIGLLQAGWQIPWCLPC